MFNPDQQKQLDNALAKLRVYGLAANISRRLPTQIVGGTSIQDDSEIRGYLNGFVIWQEGDVYRARIAEAPGRPRGILDGTSLDEAVEFILHTLVG